MTLIALECIVNFYPLPYNEGVILWDLVNPNGETDWGDGEVHLLQYFFNGVENLLFKNVWSLARVSELLMYDIKLNFLNIDGSSFKL